MFWIHLGAHLKCILCIKMPILYVVKRLNGKFIKVNTEQSLKFYVLNTLLLLELFFVSYELDLNISSAFPHISTQ